MLQHRRIFVLGTTDDDLAGYACQQLERKCFGQVDIVCYTIPLTRQSDHAQASAYGMTSQVENNFMNQRYDIFISIGLKAIQLMPSLPPYGEIVFWDVESASEKYQALTENINFFVSKHLYQ